MKLLRNIIFFSLLLTHSWALPEIHDLIDQHPELLYLANPNVAITQEGISPDQQPASYSQHLFGRQYVEFDRTIMALRCLELFLDGSPQSYAELVEAQPKNGKLSYESFLQVCSFADNVVDNSNNPEQTIQALKAAIVLGDLGKSKIAKTRFNINTDDHDDFYKAFIGKLKESPELSPTFSSLSPLGRNLLVSSSPLSHYGHITHLEGGPEIFFPLKKTNVFQDNSNAFFFDFLVHICDVAGAKGHINNQSSITYNENSHTALMAVAEACLMLTDSQKTELDAYNYYLHKRAALLGYDHEEPTERALTRVGCMMRLFSNHEGKILKQAFLDLPEPDKKMILTQLKSEAMHPERKTPTYVPAVLNNLLNNPKLGATHDQRIAETVEIGLPFIAYVLHTDDYSAPSPLCFNSIAEVAKHNPQKLRANHFTINEDRQVTING